MAEEEAAAADAAERKLEDRHEMLSRHQKEIKALREKELEMKKNAAKGSKAEQKAKKKAVEEEIAGLDARMKERHEQELASLGFVADETSEAKSLDSLVKAIAGVTTSAAAPSGKVNKGKKWRDKRAQREAEREQRIQEEQSNMVNSRIIEEQKLEKKLGPLGLSLREIKPDGHCLYRAIEDQLSLQQDEREQHSYQELRSIAAEYIRRHPQVFLPFIGGEGDGLEKLEEYCREIESTAAWGGQLELEALSHGLRKHIVVYSVDMAEVEMGKEYAGCPSLRLSYQRHAFGLGEHYNSVVPA